VEVRFTVTLDDYVAFSLHAARKSRLMQVIFVFLWLLTPAIFVGIAALILLSDGLNGPAAIEGAIFISAGILYAIIFPFFYWGLKALLTRAYAVSRGTRGVTGEITLILLEGYAG
jgi:hypothetical protein